MSRLPLLGTGVEGWACPPFAMNGYTDTEFFSLLLGRGSPGAELACDLQPAECVSAALAQLLRGGDHLASKDALGNL